MTTTTTEEELQRPPPEVRYAEELAASHAEDRDPRPPGWELSLRAARRFIVGDEDARPRPRGRNGQRGSAAAGRTGTAPARTQARLTGGSRPFALQAGTLAARPVGGTERADGKGRRPPMAVTPAG
ncbi:hypothetical protein ACIGXI_05740 [Kitasatospora aureofaciens]|uniref:hypothetical protein n=1 Tax=Kitasatospora aureofaciens TaxID=1894 RepID=UPI0037C91AEE